MTMTAFSKAINFYAKVAIVIVNGHRQKKSRVSFYGSLILNSYLNELE